ncbi:radical SAM family heme chaperone HemW [Microbacterium sp. SORGH_AS_0862]|uniref:radical SAM family heme chaperone HemW n=1 Tax=Microbacterium sp. SORGH_AS_0862 TaxID=3041789 RepID=UPI002790605E|nr:radical SAM family heme chaperone HemW [Microbacterium sp. SORGH_AS_0862]MDQ1203682.1 putative oxygen-independent coproporphyrinogen III oxidase [Microbacterium sp. SORGH_AS_0862]
MAPSVLPDGDIAPADGALPEGTVVDSGTDFGVYIHVPYCRVRCGYCDFNTYTADELRGHRRDDYPDDLSREIALATRVLADVPRPAQTVFFGGGTPTLLSSAALGSMLHAVREGFGIAEGAEITVEANPDSVTPASLAELADAGVTRVSIGMQSSVPHVLAALDRTHDPANVAAAVAGARAAGLDVSVDLIYGAPGESLADWRASVDAALALEPDHLSAYALIIEDGTKLARRIRAGEVRAPDDDLQAEMYELVDDAMADAGYDWYEVSNWARGARHRSRHNLAYWRGTDWWGFGPGAHSHVAGVRWWNVKHPAAYAQRLSQGSSPAAAREVPDQEARTLERILLESRIREGLPIEAVPSDRRSAVAGLIADGLVDGATALRGRIVLTRRGRLLADAVVRALTD